ncbi:MAG: hypothetical protein Q9170_007025 [Blastenia crenularia]
MLAIPLRPYSNPTSSSLRQDPVPIPPVQSTSASAMISMMPTPRPLTPKRPKLSLQTSTLSMLPASNQSRTALSHLSSAVDSPTTFRNTYDNAFEAPPPTPVSAKPHIKEAFVQRREPERSSPQTASSSTSISTSSSGPTSPFASTAPYTLSMGARSILRNSPLPKRHLANLANRPPKRMFQPIKRVSFPETLAEMIPTPILFDTEVGGTENTAFIAAEQTVASNQQLLDKSDGISGRRKRRGRDWIWRPVDDEALQSQNDRHRLRSTTVSSAQENAMVEATSQGLAPATVDTTNPAQPIP